MPLKKRSFYLVGLSMNTPEKSDAFCRIVLHKKLISTTVSCIWIKWETVVCCKPQMKVLNFLLRYSEEEGRGSNMLEPKAYCSGL